MAQELPMPPRTQAIQMVQDKVREIRKPKNHWSREWEIYGAKHIGFRAFIVGFFMEQKIFEMTKHNSMALNMMRWMTHGLQLQ